MWTINKLSIQRATFQKEPLQAQHVSPQVKPNNI